MANALEPGDPRQVGKYWLLGELGSGGMGRVFLARSPGGRLVAVKVIRPELAGNPEFRARFTREVTMARTVSGIYTAPVVDADLDGPQPWLATAYVDGPSLAYAVAADGPLPVRSVLPLAAGLAEGLGVIHAAGVVHRDLKPSNVLLAADGPRIIDFGISRAADGTAVTHVGSVVGSPGFMSPEQAEGGDTGPASDIFSLGAVLAFAASGEGPFGTGPATALLYRVVHAPPATGGLPAQIRSLVERCLAKDPGDRPGADQIVAELRAAHATADWLPWPSAARQEQAPPGGTAGPAGWARKPDWAAATRPAQPADAGPDRPAATRPAQPADAGPDRPAATRPAQPADAGPDAVITARLAQPADAEPPLRRGRSRLSRTLAIGIVAALAVTGGLAYQWATAPRPTRSGGGTPPAASPAASPAVTSPSPGLPLLSYNDPGVFSIELPANWTVAAKTATEIQFSGPTPGSVVIVAWSRHPRPDQLADWRQQAAGLARLDPTYHQIRIQRVNYRGYNAADWEFTEVYQGKPTHFLDRGFIVRPGHLAFAIELYGPEFTWGVVFANTWYELVNSFRPAY